MTEVTIGQEFIRESQKQFLNSLARINHCLNQLDDGDIWATYADEVNSIGVLISHLCGNIRQWILSGIGGEEDVRNRPAEFKPAAKASKKELQGKLNYLVDQAADILCGIEAKHLLDQKRIQGFDVTILGAIFSVVTHIELHAGQIVYLTRLKLGSDYILRWKPETKEQGAE